MHQLKCYMPQGQQWRGTTTRMGRQACVTAASPPRRRPAPRRRALARRQLPVLHRAAQFKHEALIAPRVDAKVAAPQPQLTLHLYHRLPRLVAPARGAGGAAQRRVGWTAGSASNKCFKLCGAVIPRQLAVAAAPPFKGKHRAHVMLMNLRGGGAEGENEARAVTRICNDTTGKGGRAMQRQRREVCAAHVICEAPEPRQKSRMHKTAARRVAETSRLRLGGQPALGLHGGGGKQTASCRLEPGWLLAVACAQPRLGSRHTLARPAPTAAAAAAAAALQTQRPCQPAASPAPAHRPALRSGAGAAGAACCGG